MQFNIFIKIKIKKNLFYFICGFEFKFQLKLGEIMTVYESSHGRTQVKGLKRKIYQLGKFIAFEISTQLGNVNEKLK